ncbi:PREDICTED: interleukin-1 receptor-associated kinase 3 [Nanorana parkeri]|uniref:interleukin-1 receptor-associated kinase 3 n=1 Tax=Nanorana parkeri TaxID=125878 RepID=UPI0008546872|nr:PREDICTED: interleukin-1 receptor-associated kinase 3 [Nanorana parkeri]
MANCSPSCSTSLFDVPPVIMETFCELMDCSDGDLGWRGLAERLSSDWRDFRKVEKYAEQGKSRTKELVWSWAHKNKTVGDLLLVLQEMGQQRAISLFREINVLSPVSLQEIKEGTKNFSSDFLIGEGQFFDVYKADIKKQLCVAKLLKKKNALADHQKQVKSFLAQWECLPRIHHPNVLQLLGYVRADESTCFVYPYLKHGSLFHRLHHTDKALPLSWQVRYNILFGVAKAIQHLHTMYTTPIICGNITSKNILLDQHFQPKLSDFAMVHLWSYLINQIKTIKMDHATLRFLGYLPEEYIRGDLSVKTDVYSYGIIIMEVLSGCQAVVVNGSKATFLVSIFVLKRIENCTASEKSSEDHPKSLMLISPGMWPLHGSLSNDPVETDETMDDAIIVYERKKETECSQSEVTFLGNTRKDRAEEKVTSLLMQSKAMLHDDNVLYTRDTPHTSRPVECSCSSGPSSITFCEECIANGFGQDQ